MCKFPSYKKTSKRVNIALNASDCKFFPQNSGKILSFSPCKSSDTSAMKKLTNRYCRVMKCPLPQVQISPFIGKRAKKFRAVAHPDRGKQQPF